MLTINIKFEIDFMARLHYTYTVYFTALNEKLTSRFNGIKI